MSDDKRSPTPRTDAVESTFAAKLTHSEQLERELAVKSDLLRAALKEPEPSSAIAPPEPTEEMCAVGAQKLYEIENHKPYGVRLERVYIARDIYKAMVAARG